MESNRYRSRDDLAHDLDISKKTIQRRVRNLKSQVIKKLCKEKRTFNSAEYQRILKALSSFQSQGMVRVQVKYGEVRKCNAEVGKPEFTPAHFYTSLLQHPFP